MNSKITTDVYAAMQDERPFKVYKKTVLAQVFVQVLNPYNGEPEGIILKGNHRADDEGCFVKLWSVKEHEFFKRMNQLHLRKGFLVPVETAKYAEITSTFEGIDYSQYTDEDIDNVLNSPFLSLRAHLNKIDSEPYALRILDRADALGKSDKITATIKSRVQEIQEAEYSEKE